MTQRPWVYQDILRISEMEKEIFPKDPWSYKTLAICFESPAFYGTLIQDDDICAYGGVSVAAGEADIQNIGVLENYRRGGLGQKILDELISHCKEMGVTSLYLEVRVSNSPALCLYLKNGFKGIYSRTRYYSDGEDALVMKKTL